MRLLICTVLLVSRTKCRGEDMIKELEAAVETRNLHMTKLLNIADEIDLLYQEYNRGAVVGHGTSLLGGKN